MIQPGKFKIHETTLVWAIDDTGVPTWRSFPITRRTAFSVFIVLDDGERRRIDRLPLERNGKAMSHGVVYHLRRHALPNDEREDLAA